jgi:acetyl-CoA synthetase
MTMTLTGDSWQGLRDNFAWEIPEVFNIGVACADAFALREPQRIALIGWQADGPTTATSYSELKAASDGFAFGLQTIGAMPGDRISIILPQCLETVIAHLGIYKAGMIAVPLARLFQPEALQYRLARAGASVVVTNRAGLDKLRAIGREALPELRHVVVTDSPDAVTESLSFADLCAVDVTGFQPAQTGPETPALIIFTSGTTGQPKGALHGHRVVIGHLPGMQSHHDFLPQPGDVAWTPADWAWAGGLLNILLPCLMLGVPVVYGGLDRFDAETALRLMAETGVRNAFIPPTALRLMKAIERPRDRHAVTLRSIGSGGEALGADTYAWAQRELGVTINEFYGQTECNLVLGSCSAIGVSRPGSTGKPVPGHEVAVINAAGQRCAIGERGQIAVLRPDPVMFLGYWDDDAATRAKFIGDWMTTGDQATVDEDGYFLFAGRDDDIINVAGYRVGPGEIEDALVSHPAVRLAVAVGEPDAVKGEVVRAFVVLVEGVDGSSALAEEIRAHAKARVAVNIYPRLVTFVDDIPLTVTGKVIRRHLRERAISERKPA